ncbi:MAG: hypothetical protein V8T65_14990 [Roseburia inulinivorans]
MTEALQCGLVEIMDSQIGKVKKAFEKYTERHCSVERIVVSQFVEKYKGESYASMMLRYKNYKYISYHHYENKDMLFNLKEDPKEGHNCITEKPEVVEYLKNERRKLISFYEMEKQRADHGKRAQLFIAVKKTLV